MGKINKRNLFVWSLYDFANSIVMIVFLLYFSQWLVIDRGISDFWFNITFTISSLLLLFSGPIAGAIVDKTKIKMPGLRITTVFTAIFYLLTGITAVQYPSHAITAMIMFTLATYFYMFSFNYYNPLINDIAPQGKHGIVSGWGIFGNYLGHISGILIALPFATGAIVLWGNLGRAQVFIPATVIFILSTLPMLLLFKEKSIREQVRVNITDEYKNAFRSFVNLCKESKLGYFFLAYFFFNDAVITASINFPIYLEKVFNASDFIKSLILIGILVTSVIGSPISGWIADRIGIKKR